MHLTETCQTSSLTLDSESAIHQKHPRKNTISNVTTHVSVLKLTTQYSNMAESQCCRETIFEKRKTGRNVAGGKVIEKHTEAHPH